MRVRVARSLVLLAVAMLLLSTASFAQVGVSITIGPPMLPVYEQPICPGDGYIWTPGYWAWDDGYYWVPGTWVLAPEIGFLWTPGYWGWGGDGFMFYPGYWGPQIGFYGGVNYGFGYFGRGYEGGRWDHGHFFYNSRVNNVNVNVIHNVYDKRVNEAAENRISYNGGNGGINARPTREDEAAARERHIAPLAVQTQHAEAARNEPQQRFSANHGAPPVAATDTPGAFKGRGAVPAREAAGGAARPENNARPNAAVHPKDLPPIERPAPPSTGNPKLDQKYQQQQEKIIAKQNQDRQKLQQQQDKEHQQMAKQQANEARMQQTEQRHQQQTQQLQQRHTQQMHQMQQRQQPPAGGSRGGERR